MSALLSPYGASTFAMPVDPSKIGTDLAEVIRTHDALLGAYARTQDVLPLQLGTSVSDPDDASTLISRHHKAFSHVLTSLDGRAEYTVRLSRERQVTTASTLARTGTAPETDGQNYLAKRLKERGAAEAARQQISVFVTRVRLALENGGVVSSLSGPCAHPDRIAGWSCLMRPTAAAKAAMTLEQLRGTATELGLGISLSGPHAPFAFATQQIGHAEMSQVGSLP